MKRIALSFAVLALSIGNYAYATTYTYTGNNFDTVTGVYSTSHSVSRSFTVASALPADMDGDISQQVLSYSFTDGVNTLNESNSVLCTGLAYGILVGTDSNGNLDEWSVSICTPVSTVPSPVHMIMSLNAGALVADVGGVSTCIGVDGDACDEFSDEVSTDAGQIQGQAGTWTRSGWATPVPTLTQWSLVLLALGLGMLGIARIRRNV